MIHINVIREIHDTPRKRGEMEQRTDNKLNDKKSNQTQSMCISQHAISANVNRM